MKTVKRENSWSKWISLDALYLTSSMHPDGASISVRFRCTKCEEMLVVHEVEIPPFGLGETDRETRIWGDPIDVTCGCNAEYELLVDSSCVGWGIEITRADSSFSAKSENPKAFQYRLEADYGSDWDQIEDPDWTQEDES